MEVRSTWSGRLVYCEKCDRLTVAQVVSARGENLSQTAASILASISDHREDSWTQWALYGLEFAVPEGYEWKNRR